MQTKLNLGSGEHYRRGFLNVDTTSKFKKDLYVDATMKLPFKDNTFKYVYIRHVFEHLPQDNLGFICKELARVCRRGAIIDLFAPHFSCGKTFMSHDHKTFFSYFTFTKGKFPHLKILRREFSFMRSELPYTGRPILNTVAKILNPFLSFIPNIIPFIYERLFCWSYPVEEVSYRFEVVKR